MNYIKSFKDILRKLNYILNREQKRWAFAMLILIAIGAVVETLGVSVIIPLIEVMMTPDIIRNGLPIASLAERAQSMSDMELMVWVGVGVIIVYILKNLYLTFLSYIRAWYTCKIQRELSVKMMKSYIGRGYSYFLNTNVSHLLRGVNGDVGGVQSVINSLFKIITEGMTAIFIVVYIMIQDFLVALIVAGIGAACVLVLTVFFKGKMSRYGELYRDYIGITNKNSLETFEGIKEIMVMRRERHFSDEYERNYDIMQNANIVHTVASEVPAYVIEASCIAGLVVALIVRMSTSVDVAAFIPKLAGFAIAAFRILPSLGRITSAANSMVYAIPSMNACYENVYEANNFQYNPMQLEADKTATTVMHPLFFDHEITLQDIHFHYDNSDIEVLDGINMSIRKGTSVALVGSSGAGKTTLADVILGLLYPQKGDILVDGQSIYKNRNGWSKLIGFVPQAVYLTDDTIRHNVAFGIDEDQIDDDKVWHALEQAQLDQFVRDLPDGLNNIVGDRGIRISGGQRQRIAIARALYEDPEILVLDEATSALDSETETAVMESINYLHGKKTLIIIAHRLSTIENCEYKYEVGGGQIQERTDL